MPVRNLVVILLAAIVGLICYETAQRNRFASTFVEAMEIVEREALEDVPPRELFNAAMNGMLQSVDEHSAFIDPEMYPSFRENLQQEFAGIGITVGLRPNTSQLMVLDAIYNAPAHRAGVRPGDLVVDVDGVPMLDKSLDEAVRAMRGKPGTMVSVTLARASTAEQYTINVARQPLSLDSVLGDRRSPDGGWEFQLEDHPRIGYLRIGTFGDRTVEETREVLKRVVPRSDAIVIDLRDNAGGLLDAAVDIADMFLDDGQIIVTTRGRNEVVRETYYGRTDRTIIPRNMVVVVLANRFSASASEILTAALKDHERAVVVGERTWGKGTVQNVIEMENGRSVIKLTTASYWRPNGTNIHRLRDSTEEDAWGVQPTEGMLIKLTEDEYRKLALQRRNRDFPDARIPVAEVIEAPGPNGNEADPSTSNGEADEFDDPHLNRAIEYIIEALQQRVVRAGSTEEISVP